MSRILVSVIALLMAASSGRGQPKYKLELGQELAYRTTYTFKYGVKDRTGEVVRRTDWAVWVVRANPDGSRRVVVRQEEKQQQVSGGRKLDRPGQTRVLYADIFPDGRVSPNPTITPQAQFELLFPRLPKDATEEAGWSWTHDGGRIVAKPVKKGGAGFRFETATDTPENAIFVSTNTSVVTFDPELGRVAGGTFAGTQEYGLKGKGEGAIEFVAARPTDAAAAKLLASESAGYFESLTAYTHAKVRTRNSDAGTTEKRLRDALAALKAANAGLAHPVLKADFATRLKQSEQEAAAAVEDAKRRAGVVGKPAPEFASTEVGGRAFRLADLKGKVVVLDFWYRGCGWCIKAMPQLNGLTEDFAGQPVAVLGMNTDEDEADARFVIEKMGLKYPTVRAKGAADKLGVEGFPTLVVIDKAGVVHDIHVGYSPTLRRDVGQQIRELLKNP